jgi:hypothetical protein
MRKLMEAYCARLSYSVGQRKTRDKFTFVTMHGGAEVHDWQTVDEVGLRHKHLIIAMPRLDPCQQQEEAVTFMVEVKGQDGSVLTFKLKKTTRMHEVMEVYCAKNSLLLGAVKFLFGHRGVGFTDTPETLGMAEGTSNMVEAMWQLQQL